MRNKRVRSGIFVLALVVIIILIAVFYNPQPTETIKIGVLVPLTGSASSVGEDVMNSISLASEDLKNKNIQLIVQDSKCKPADGVTAYNKLVDVDNVVAVIGVTCSGVAKAIGPLANEKEVPTILSVASSYMPENKSAWVFKFWPSNKERAAFEANFIMENLDPEKIAVIYENSAFGTGLYEEFEKKFIELGGNIAISEAYDPKTTDFRTSLTKIKAENPDIIFAISYEPSAINILKQAKELGINKQFVGISSLISQSFLDSIGEIGEGLIIDFPITKSESTGGFEERFLEKYNDNIIHPGGYFAYDSLIILEDVLDETSDRGEIKDKLYLVSIIGVSGLIEFDEYGKNKEKDEFATLIVRNGEFVPYGE